MRKIIASIDIGTNSIKIVVGEIIKSKLNVLAVSDASSEGLKKGLIVNPEEVAQSLKNGLKKVEEMLGSKISKAIVTIPAVNAEFTLGDGSTTVMGAEKVITGKDIIMAMQASVYNKIPSNMEMITVIPTMYKLDGDRIVRDAKGMTSNKLTVKTLIAMTPRKNVYSVLQVMEKAGIKVVDIAFGSIGDYYAYKNEEMENCVGAIINLGAATTTVSIFNKGVITNTEVIDLGSKNIDNDISFIYKIDVDIAKELKENLALAHKRLANASETYETVNKLGEKVKVNQYELSEIVMSRITEILNLTKKQINLLTKKEISYIIFTGGLSESKDFNLILEEVYGHNATIGKIHELGVRDNKFSSSVGLIKYFSDRMNLKDKEFSIFTEEELEELINTDRRISFGENSILGKIFGYFFDN